MKRLAPSVARPLLVALCWLAVGSTHWAQEWSMATDQPPDVSAVGQSGYVVPGPPTQPMTGSRPAGWPTTPPGPPAADAIGHVVGPSAYITSQVPAYPTTGAPGPALGLPYAPTPVSMAPPPSPPAADPWNAAAHAQLQLGAPEACEGASVLARVGSEFVLLCDLLPSVNEVLEQYKSRIPPSQLDAQREMLLRTRLKNCIDTKLVYLDARETIPEENFPAVEKDLVEYWDEKYVPDMLERSGAPDRRRLEEQLAAMGSSLEREKQLFMEKAIAAEWLKQNAKPTGEITRAQMLAYYREHIAEFSHVGKVRWQQLSVNFDRFGTKAEAYEALSAMGNMVLQGKSMEDVARAHSDGPTAAEGGMYDWTTEGSLADEGLNQALFGLPVDRLSRIIEGRKAFHIVRVVERVEAGCTPFEETQNGIIEKIKDERKTQATNEYVEKLRRRYPVWTVFDGRPLPETAGRPQPPAR